MGKKQGRQNLFSSANTRFLSALWMYTLLGPLDVEEGSLTQLTAPKIWKGQRQRQSPDR